MTERPGTVVQCILAAIAAGGPRGATQNEMRQAFDIGSRHISVEVNRLKKDGHIFSVGPAYWSRYFLSAAEAEACRPAWLIEIETAKRERARKTALGKLERRKQVRAELRAQRPPKPPKAAKPKGKRGSPEGSPWRAESKRLSTLKAVKAQAANVLNIIVPQGVKRTVWPTAPGRYEVTGPVIGGFATAGIGRYLEMV